MNASPWRRRTLQPPRGRRLSWYAIDLAAAGLAVLTVGTGSALNLTGALTSNVYDHMLAFWEGETRELLEPPVVLDLRSDAMSRVTFPRTVSDHLPVVARFAPKGAGVPPRGPMVRICASGGGENPSKLSYTPRSSSAQTCPARTCPTWTLPART